MAATKSPFSSIISSHTPDMSKYESLYKHFHSHGELSTQESETASAIASHLKSLSKDIDIRTSIGGHGLIAILTNKSESPTVMLRADIDALPILEKTGLDYASKKTMKDVDGETKPVMHACGHDFHITSMLAAAEILISSQAEWTGRIIFLFQPAEERGVGSKNMVEDGLYDKSKHACPIPDVVLGQHVFPIKAGVVATRPGPVMSAADSFKITIYGRGGHGSMPHRCIDTAVIASTIVVRLQHIVSREIPPDETAVVTVGAINAGSTENVISDEATIKINIRTFTPIWRTRILESVKRIAESECQASRCPKPPLIEPTSQFPLTSNHEDITAKIDESFASYFGANHHPNMSNALGSEDFSTLATAVDKPYCFWFFGGHDAVKWDEMEKEGKGDEWPVNHSPFFAPAVQPTLNTGAEALVVGALTFLDTKTAGR